MSQTIEIEIAAPDQMLQAAAATRNNLNLRLLTRSDRERAWAIWETEIAKGENPTEALDTVTSEIEDWLECRRTPACPCCGSRNLIELRDAVAYMKVRSVRVLGSHPILTEPEPTGDVSIFDSADLWRCENCEFETEDENVIVETARLGAPEHGVRVIGENVHVAVVDDNNGERSARVHVFDPVSETWTRVIGPGNDTFPLPIPAGSPDELVTEALEVLAGKIGELHEQITGCQDPVESEEESFQLNDLFETTCWAVAAEYAKQHLPN